MLSQLESMGGIARCGQYRFESSVEFRLDLPEWFGVSDLKK